MRAGELRLLAIDWLAETYPGSLIVPELSIGTWGSALLDVAAITESEIIGVEIKGEGDSPARLRLQAALYSKAATRMFLLPCADMEARCFKHIPAAWGRLCIREGRAEPALTPWQQRQKDLGWGFDLAERLSTSPHQLLQCLWRNELDEIARLESVITGKVDVEALRWKLAESVPLERLRSRVCYALRHRGWNRARARGCNGVVWSPERDAA